MAQRVLVIRATVTMALLASLMMSASAPILASMSLSREYELKAAFIYNFTRFIEWSPESIPDASLTTSLCVVGRDPFGRSLDQRFEVRVRSALDHEYLACGHPRHVGR